MTRDSIVRPTRTAISLAAITLLGACLRLLHLGQKSYWWDEIATIRLARMPLPEFLHALWRFEANMSFYYLLVRGWIQFGDGEAWLRLLSAIFAIAAIPAIYAVGKVVSGRTTGLLAALILSVNAAHVAYAQEARSYSLLIFLCLLSLLFFLRMDESGTFNAVSYVAVSTLAVYTHFFAVFFLAAQWSSLPWRRWTAGQWKKFLLPIFVTAVLISPALAYMAFRRTEQLAWLGHPNVREIVQLVYVLVANLGAYRRELAILYLVLGVLALRGAFWGARTKTDAAVRWRILVVATCVGLPVVLVYAISFWTPIFFPRFLLICLPPFVLLAAHGLADLRPSWFRLAACALVVALSVGALRSYYQRPKDDWRGLTGYLLQHAQAGDVVVACPSGAEAPIEYYGPRLGQASSSELSYLGPDTLVQDIESHRSMGKALPSTRLWIVEWGEGPESKRVLATVAPDYERIAKKQFPNSLTVGLYARTGK
jgi:mannosyltransferase